MSRNFVYLVLIILVFTGCSKYGYVYLSYPQDPAAYLPHKVNEIAIVNRSLTREQDKKDKVLEAIVTAEVAGSDRLASDQCLKGVFDAGQSLNGFTVLFPQHTRLYGTGTRETPELLDWKLVSAICDSVKADALLVLETFDSNSDLLLSAVSSQAAAILSGEIPKPAIPNQIKMNVYCYWRLYYPVSKRIIDQYQHTTYMTFNTEGKIPPPDALPQTAYVAGQDYIQRFLPSYYSVKRNLYKKAKGKGKHEFKAGYRRAEVANWEGAIEIWSEIIKYAKRKTAGRACLDIAVAYEVLGNTDLALQWAKKSYEYYNDKLGREYAKILLRRQSLEN